MLRLWVTVYICRQINLPCGPVLNVWADVFLLTTFFFYKLGKSLNLTALNTTPLVLAMILCHMSYCITNQGHVSKIAIKLKQTNITISGQQIYTNVYPISTFSTYTAVLTFAQTDVYKSYFGDIFPAHSLVTTQWMVLSEDKSCSFKATLKKTSRC